MKVKEPLPSEYVIFLFIYQKKKVKLVGYNKSQGIRSPWLLLFIKIAPFNISRHK